MIRKHLLIRTTIQQAQAPLIQITPALVQAHQQVQVRLTATQQAPTQITTL